MGVKAVFHAFLTSEIIGGQASSLLADNSHLGKEPPKTTKEGIWIDSCIHGEEKNASNLPEIMKHVSIILCL